MKGIHSQLPLALFETPRLGFDEFHGTSNRRVRDALKGWAEGDAHWCVNVWGETGTGKTHLLQAAIRHADQAGRVAMYLPLREVFSFGPGVLENLEQIEALAIDDLDLAVGHEHWEFALFALYNNCAAAERRWIFATKNRPANLSLRLADLQSRLSSALIYQLHDPTDPEKQQILRALAHARGMELSDAVASFLMRRLPRSMATLVAALDTLDSLSLRAARPLTVPFVREALALGSDG
ncbi:MAG: DnaA regulatory inactivator Hda [Gammaproteobacteria bacterium]|nr:DnaA regulatory inactivator Hda [Gammaproteobacteria bacterium]